MPFTPTASKMVFVVCYNMADYNVQGDFAAEFVRKLTTKYICAMLKDKSEQKE